MKHATSITGIRSSILRWAGSVASRAGLAATSASEPKIKDSVLTLAASLRANDEARGAKRRGFWRLDRSGFAGDIYVALLRINRFDAVTRILDRDTVDTLLASVRGRILQIIASAELGRSTRGMIDVAFIGQTPEDALAQMQRLVDAFDQPIVIQDKPHQITVSVGLAQSSSDHDVAVTIERAEHALALSESSPVRCVLWNAELLEEAAGRQALARDLRTALAAGGLSVVYQPKLQLRTGVIDSAEALVRWAHPQRGPISPELFVGLAEETGDILQLTKFVLERAIADQARLKSQGYELAINVNVSPTLVADGAFCDWVVSACRQASGEIGLEITETAIFTHPERALANLNRFVSNNIGVAIDDYGSGLSSLAYLRQLPARELKIDKMFILGLTSSHRDPLLVRSTIDLAHALDMEVTAEGVDHPQALALLRIMGCDRAQGFHIAEPLALGDFEDFLGDPSRHGGDVNAPGLSLGRA